MQPHHDSIFWIEVEKIRPNPFQPRREFDEGKLSDLAESIRQYGVLQPLVVTRREIEKEDGGIMSEYELIAGERRLRASKLAGLLQIPAVIRREEDDDKVKLEIAIIENLQREDLSPVDRAKAFQRLVDEFRFKHTEIARKVSKSREYVSNSLRLLALPEEILRALAEKRISEGHARPLMMLGDRPEEQMTLFKEILFKHLTVRDAENIARRIAYDKVRKKDRFVDPELVDLEEKLADKLGARVHIERKQVGGKITIDFTSIQNLQELVDAMNKREGEKNEEAISAMGLEDIETAPTPQGEGWGSDFSANAGNVGKEEEDTFATTSVAEESVHTPETPHSHVFESSTPATEELHTHAHQKIHEEVREEKDEDEDDLYSIRNFSL